MPQENEVGLTLKGCFQVTKAYVIQADIHILSDVCVTRWGSLKCMNIFQSAVQSLSGGITLSASEGGGWEVEGSGWRGRSGCGGRAVQQSLLYADEELQHAAQHCGPGLHLP